MVRSGLGYRYGVSAFDAQLNNYCPLVTCLSTMESAVSRFVSTTHRSSLSPTPHLLATAGRGHEFQLLASTYNQVSSVWTSVPRSAKNHVMPGPIVKGSQSPSRWHCIRSQALHLYQVELS